jgi:hypothetical protein
MYRSTEVVVQVAFTPAKMPWNVESGPAFTNSSLRTQSNAKNGFLNHQMLLVNHQMPSKSLLISYDVITDYGDA